MEALDKLFAEEAVFAHLGAAMTKGEELVHQGRCGSGWGIPDHPESQGRERPPAIRERATDEVCDAAPPDAEETRARVAVYRLRCLEPLHRASRHTPPVLRQWSAPAKMPRNEGVVEGGGPAVPVGPLQRRGNGARVIGVVIVAVEGRG